MNTPPSGAPTTRSRLPRWLPPLAAVFLALAVLAGVLIPLLTSAWLTALMAVIVLAVTFAVIAVIGIAVSRRSQQRGG
ncbi:MAG: hypothetical protein Q7T71_09635 [Herbiconiux sp.]|nr:hypothetical protein [Herbiconiux sp.]